jgi:hypothetical protein
MSDFDVMRLLADPAQRDSASRELQRRGFGQRELQVAAALVAPDPQVREQLAENLPLLSGIDPHPWLLLLARDEIARVRAIAVRWLVTSSDPRIREFLVELANHETDDQVRQALRQRQAASGVR